MASHANSTPAPSAGHSFRPTLLAMRRRALEDWIEKAIALLDALDPNPDEEPDACFELATQKEVRGGANVRAL